MATMTAYQLVEWGAPPEFREVEVPTPAPDEVLIRVAGVGLCHSDFMFLDSPPGVIPWSLPFTLGHESAGWVEQLGAEVDDLEIGQAVAVAGIHSCGRCQYCIRGQDNYCPRGASGRGYGEDGGLAHFLVVPRRELVPLTTLDPRRVGPLTDAGATSYHAVKRALPKLIPGSTAVVIGAGGLGSYAVQFLRRLTGAQVIAVDVVQQRLDLARELGAHVSLMSDETTSTRVRELTGGLGATAVFDFVGDDTTMKMALATAATLGTVAIVGAGGGTAKVSWGVLPLECDLYIPMAASIADLHEVIALAETGELRVEVELFDFDRAPDAYERFRQGDLRSRAVVTPNG
ncbi:MAG: alcohol dehydrogenase, propanol-preferring [Actinomycetota bacterium]|nr:alcohol dehydrogenase, propanol-preferring [Actinomycetota bacterium]